MFPNDALRKQIFSYDFEATTFWDKLIKTGFSILYNTNNCSSEHSNGLSYEGQIRTRNVSFSLIDYTLLAYGITVLRFQSFIS